MSIKVTVTYTAPAQPGQPGTLTVSPSEIPYKQDNWVEWKFENIPPGSFGYLRFDNAPALGPFHTLRTLAHDSIVGKGNTGAPSGITRHPYQAMLLNRTDCGVLATVSGAAVLQEAASPNTMPDVTVTYQDGKELLVVPDRIGLNLGDTATWHFREFPPGYFATLQFGSSPDETPFADFYVTAPLPGEPTGAFSAHGIGFRTKIVEDSPDKYAIHILDLPASLDYHVQVREPNGKIAGAHDPVIDNLGPPVPD
jgi:hypothetical protein